MRQRDGEGVARFTGAARHVEDAASGRQEGRRARLVGVTAAHRAAVAFLRAHERVRRLPPRPGPEDGSWACACACHARDASDAPRDAPAALRGCCVRARSAFRRQGHERARRHAIESLRCCIACGATDRLQAAHLTPVATLCRWFGDAAGRAVAHDPSNVVVLCARCHEAQHRDRFSVARARTDHLKAHRGWGTPRELEALWSAPGG